jgi:YggT family protein
LQENVFESHTKSILERVWQVIDYLFLLAYGVVTLQIVLELAGASDSSRFKQFLNTITAPLLGPFVGLFADPVFKNVHRLRISYVVALFIYMLAHLAVYGLFRLIQQKKKSPEWWQ